MMSIFKRGRHEAKIDCREKVAKGMIVVGVILLTISVTGLISLKHNGVSYLRILWEMLIR